MNRRDLIKTALSLPLVHAVQGWSSVCDPCTNTAKSPYQVVLEGPFGVILHKDTASPPNVTGITAFMPIDPDGRHHFSLDGTEQDVSKQFSFSLTQKPPLSTKLCIDSAFADFCVDSTSASLGSKTPLLKIEMPVPTNILAETTFTPMNVVFQSTKSGKMQRSFVLVYDVNNGAQLQLTEQPSGLNITLPSDKLIVEVGLPKSDPDSADFAHAKKFYNKTLLPFFGLDASPDHVVTSIKGPARTPRTTTYECKAGGIIGGTTP